MNYELANWEATMSEKNPAFHEVSKHLKFGGKFKYWTQTQWNFQGHQTHTPNRKTHKSMELNFHMSAKIYGQFSHEKFDNKKW
jgi:hypothetical protein